MRLRRTRLDLLRLLAVGFTGGWCFGTKKNCQANSTPIDSTMARMKLRLFSSMSLSARGLQLGPALAYLGSEAGEV